MAEKDKKKRQMTAAELGDEIFAGVDECIGRHPILGKLKGKELDEVTSRARLFAIVGADAVIRNMSQIPQPGKGLRVIILGPAGSGKSTFAKVIMDALRAGGFNAFLEDHEDLPPDATRDARLKSLAGTTIPIITRNTSP